MASTPKLRNLKLLAGVFFLLLGSSLGSCVDGPSPMELPQDGTVAQFALVTDFTRALATEGAAPINRIRITARVVGTGEVVGQVVQEVNSADPDWTIEISVSIPTGPNPQVILTVELINVDGGVETVEWSGETASIPLQAATTPTTQTVTVVRGPLDNLAVTAVAIIAPSQLRTGKSAQLSATVATSDAGSTPQLFWASLSPAVGTVSSSGLFQALAPGTALVVATAGAAADTASIKVLPAIHKVVVEPTLANAHSLGVELIFQAWVLDTNQEPIAGETVTWTVDDAEVMENKGGGTFVSVGEGTAMITATSDSEPSLAGSATVEVKQVAVRVDVSPAVDTLEAVGETSQFSAEAYDENDNPIPSAVFAWGSDDEGVATIDQTTGLATAQGGGETEIWAEVMGADASSAQSVVGAGAQGVEGGTGVYGRAKVVVDLPLTLSVTPTAATLKSLGATVQLTPVAVDGSGHPVTGLTYTWASSDPGVATVDANGLVTAVKEGQTTVKVSAGGTYAEAVITVKQEVAGFVWVVQPPNGYMDEELSPAPVTDAVDALGNRVESWEGEASVFATWLGWSEASQSPPITSPQKSAAGTTFRLATAGRIVWSGLWITGGDGYFKLTTTATIGGKAVHAESHQFEIYYSRF